MARFVGVFPLEVYENWRICDEFREHASEHGFRVIEIGGVHYYEDDEDDIATLIRKTWGDDVKRIAVGDVGRTRYFYNPES